MSQNELMPANKHMSEATHIDKSQDAEHEPETEDGTLKALACLQHKDAHLLNGDLQDMIVPQQEVQHKPVD